MSTAEKRSADIKARIEKFNEWIAAYSAEERKISGRINIVVVCRIVAFLLALFMGWQALKTGLMIWWTGAAGMLIVLISLVRVHLLLTRKRNIASEITRFNEKEILSLRGDQSVFDSGDEFIDGTHPYALDLDLFGIGGLFPFLNRTVTSAGKEALAARLLDRETNPGTLRQTQEAVSELSKMVSFRLSFFGTGRVMREEKGDEEKLQAILKMHPVFRSFRWAHPLSLIIPAGMISILIFFALGWVPWSAVLLYMILPLTAEGVRVRQINRYQNEISEASRILKKYDSLIRLIEKEHYKSTALKKLKQQLKYKDLSAGDLIRKLWKTVDMFDARQNLLVGFVLNILVMWDFHCLWAIRQWKQKYGAQVKIWFAVLAEMDALNSLAAYALRFPGVCWPEVREHRELHIEAKRLGHPLIDHSKRVDNDFKLEGNGSFYILTGPNMAGKSTFLRALGVNDVLAHAGAPVCAGHYAFAPHDLISSMRTTDSLKDDASYFFAELQRLREIMEILGHESPVMILLDEILKGTNSRDKTKGSLAVIRRMIELGGSGVVATHDLSLTVLEEQIKGKVYNICFEATREGDRLIYDYRLRQGVARNMNATFLMEQMGIIPPGELAPVKSRKSRK